MSRRKKKTNNITKLVDVFDINNIIITNHAYDRFKERSEKLQLYVGCPKSEIKRLLQDAVEEQLSDGHRIERILNNDYQDAFYYICDGWRFVIVNKSPEEIVLVTVEREKRSQNY